MSDGVFWVIAIVALAMLKAGKLGGGTDQKPVEPDYKREGKDLISWVEK